MSMKNSNDTIGNRTRDLPACSAVPQDTAEPLVPEPSALEVGSATEKLKSHKSPGTDHIPAELIKAGG